MTEGEPLAAPGSDRDRQSPRIHGLDSSEHAGLFPGVAPISTRPTLRLQKLSALLVILIFVRNGPASLVRTRFII